MSETRVRAATLLCRIFLHHLVVLVEWEGMLGLWVRILEIMDRLMNSGQGDTLVSPSSAFFMPSFTCGRVLLMAACRRKPSPRA